MLKSRAIEFAPGDQKIVQELRHERGAIEAHLPSAKPRPGVVAPTPVSYTPEKMKLAKMAPPVNVVRPAGAASLAAGSSVQWTTITGSESLLRVSVAVV